MPIDQINSIVEKWLSDEDKEKFEALPLLDEDLPSLSSGNDALLSFKEIINKNQFPQDASFETFNDLIPLVNVIYKNDDVSHNGLYLAVVLSIFFTSRRDAVNYLKIYEKEHPNCDEHTFLSDVCLYLLNSDPNKLIESVIEANKWETVKWMVERNNHYLNFNIGFEGKTILHYAARRTNVDMIKWLIDKGANASAFDHSGSGLQHYAAANGHLEILSYLAKIGLDMNLQNFMGNTPLNHALLRSKMNVAKWLIEDQSVNVKLKNIEGDTPLHIAAEECNSNIVNSLVEHGAEPNILNRAGNTPIQLAARRGHWDNVKYLYGFIKEKNLKDNNGKALLHYAAESAPKGMIEWLINQGEDINITDNLGGTPLLKLIKGSRWPEAISLIKEYHANVNTQDEYRWTPISYINYPGNFFFSRPPSELINLLSKQTNTTTIPTETPYIK